jgi:signal transduction histidine kinase/CheY-like chemotaxis protein
LFRTIRLRTKFLLSLLAITAGMTAATLAVVSYNVESRVRESLRDELHDSVKTYQTFAGLREATMLRSAALLANLPNVRALMTTDDPATIQDEVPSIFQISGADLLILVNRSGQVVGLQTKSNAFSKDLAANFLRHSMPREDGRNWWLAGGHLHEVWLQPIYFGPAGQGSVIGFLAVGHEIDDHVAHEFSGVVSSEIIFQSGTDVLASSLPRTGHTTLLSVPSAERRGANDVSRELQLDHERYLAATVDLSEGGTLPVTLNILRSLDKETQFLKRLNQILLALGLLSVLAGGTLVFLISHTFTRPLSNLVSGVRALAEGNFDFPVHSIAYDEVGEVTTAFDRMRTNLQKTQAEQRQLEDRLRQAHKMEAVGRLAGGVAHDFNNLLTVIRGNSDLLFDRTAADPSQRKYVEQIQKASERAASMTRQLLAFSRMQVLQPRVIDLNATVAEMNKMIPRLIGEHIEFSFLPGSRLAPVFADPGQMEQVFLNLAVNARDAMPTGGRLVVRTANVQISPSDAALRPPMSPGDYVLLSVSDSGQGMDAETKARIFEPFFTTKEAGKGTGLGLATVYGIVKQTGGFIWVEGEKGNGATFEIYLPSSQKPVAASEDAIKAKPIPRGTETILLVEDETGVRELASEFLKAGGYTVLEARDGSEALKLAANRAAPIHLLLTDMVMPHVNGTEVATNLLASRPDLRIIFMTGYAEFSPQDGSRIPEAVVIQKPFSRQTLLEKVREVLSSAALNLPNRSIV